MISVVSRKYCSFLRNLLHQIFLRLDTYAQGNSVHVFYLDLAKTIKKQIKVLLPSNSTMMSDTMSPSLDLGYTLAKSLMQAIVKLHRQN